MRIEPHLERIWERLAQADGQPALGQAWSERYQAHNYLRIDPVVAGCYRRFEPVDWKDLDWSSRAARQFRRDALDHGVGDQGFSVPIRGPHGQFALFTRTTVAPIGFGPLSPRGTGAI